MTPEYWENSPFGENSLFHPNREKERLAKEQQQFRFSALSQEGVEIFLINNRLISKDADGYYYSEEGTFYGKHGTSDLISLCSKVVKVDGKNQYHIQSKTDIKYENLILVAGTAIGESSYGYEVENKFEVYAIANAILNYYRLENLSNGTIKDSIIKMKAFAAIHQNAVFKKFIGLTDDERNNNFCKEAIGAALNCLNEKRCFDYSNGATHWDGIDITQSGRKWQEGLKFLSEDIDIFEIGDNKKSVKQKYKDGKFYERIYDYKWIGTAGYSGINEKKKNAYFPYFEGDSINKNKFGTVLMRLSDDFRNKLKYGDKKVE